MPETPRLLVIERDTSAPSETWAFLEERYEIIRVRSVAQAIAVLRERPVVGVFVDAAQLPALRWIGMRLQADEILDAIADGVVVVGPDQVIIWTNPEFQRLCGSEREVVGIPFEKALGTCEPMPSEGNPFMAAATTRQPADSICKLSSHRYLRITVTPISNAAGSLSHLIALTRDITAEVQQQQKIDAIHEVGEQLADLLPEDLAELGVEQRKDLLKLNIVHHMKDLLGLDFIQIRLLEPDTKRLVPLLTEGMPSLAERELFAREDGNGVTGFVAATGLSYLCPDTARDPLYIEGAVGARSALTVPLIHHGTVIGTLNVESPQPAAFSERDRQFVEIFARGIAASLNTLELLSAEKRQVASASIEAMSSELALPLDEILNDATTVLDRYGGHDEEIVARLKHLLTRVREIRGLIPKVGSALASDVMPHAEPPLHFAGTRLLIVDADESIRRAAHTLLGREGAIVETARDAREALALARQSPYSAALVDIRLPDMVGYDVFRQLREIQPGLPVILMTGFGYDPTHAIVQARQEGLKIVLYKPFRADRLIEAVDQAIRGTASGPRAKSAPPPRAAVSAEGDSSHTSVC